MTPSPTTAARAPSRTGPASRSDFSTQASGSTSAASRARRSSHDVRVREVLARDRKPLGHAAGVEPRGASMWDSGRAAPSGTSRTRRRARDGAGRRAPPPGSGCPPTRSPAPRPRARARDPPPCGPCTTRRAPPSTARTPRSRRAGRRGGAGARARPRSGRRRSDSGRASTGLSTLGMFLPSLISPSEMREGPEEGAAPSARNSRDGTLAQVFRALCGSSPGSLHQRCPQRGGERDKLGLAR